MNSVSVNRNNRRTDRKISESRLRRKAILRKRIGCTVLAIVLMVSTSAVIITKVDAKNKKIPGNIEKKYESIQIQDGDTLWSIAEKYADTRYTNMVDYIDELKSMNNLHGDKIIGGTNLIITYYV